MRRFALRLGVNHSTLSRLLRGSRPIPLRTIRRLGNVLGMSEQEIGAFSAIENAEAVVRAIGRSGFRPDSRWLASVAGISIDKVNIALVTLLRSGTLRMRGRSEWVVTKETVE